MYDEDLIKECKQPAVNTEKIAELLEKDADVNYQDDDNSTALHYLCEAENINLEAVNLLLAKENIDLDVTDNFGKTAFLVLISQANINIEALKLFLAKEHIPINLQEMWGNTPLHLLCQKKNINETACTLLLEKKAAIDIKNDLGRTALHYLCLQDTINMPMIKLFLAKGANPNIKDTESGKTPFEIILKHCKNKNDFKVAIDFLYCIPANKDNTITLIIDDIEQQNALKTLEIPVNFKEYYKVQSEEMRNSVFGFYSTMHRLKQENKLSVPKPVLGMIAAKTYFFHKIIVNNSKGEQQQLIDMHDEQTFNPTKN